MDNKNNTQLIKLKPKYDNTIYLKEVQYLIHYYKDDIENLYKLLGHRIIEWDNFMYSFNTELHTQFYNNLTNRLTTNNSTNKIVKKVGNEIFYLTHDNNSNNINDNNSDNINDKPDNELDNNLTTLITCVNYYDILKYTLPNNIRILKNIIIVTDNNDKDTVDLCNKLNTKCIKTDIFYKREPFNFYSIFNIFNLINLSWWNKLYEKLFTFKKPFNKAKAINYTIKNHINRASSISSNNLWHAE